MEPCELQEECSFHLKHRESLVDQCRRFIACYCYGPLQQRCARKNMAGGERSHLAPDVLPSGEHLCFPGEATLPSSD